MTLHRTRDHGSSEAPPIAARTWLALGLLWLASLYLWIPPLVRPRGGFLWGHYRLSDLLLGVPVGLATVCATAVILSPARRRRDRGLRLAAVCLSALFGIAAFDLLYCLAVARIWSANAWYDDLGVIRAYNHLDPELGYVRKPGLSMIGDPDLPDLKIQISGNVYYRPDEPQVYYRTDVNGFRNAAGIQQADIVFIGDRLTEGEGVTEEETFAQLVGAGAGLRVVNLGRAGYGPQQEAIVLRRYGLAYKPRFVVWQFWEGNDLTDAEHYPRWIAHPERSQTTLLQRYQKHSPVIALLKRTLLMHPDPGYATVRFSDGKLARLVGQGTCDPDVQAEFPVGLAETKKAIESTYRLCRSQGLELVVLCFPHRECVLDPYIVFDSPAIREKSFPGGILEGRRGFARIITAFCDKLGCACIDTFPAFRQRAARDNRRLFFLRIHHMDIEGHKVIARVVLDWLKTKPRTRLPAAQSGDVGRAAGPKMAGSDLGGHVSLPPIDL